MALKLTASLGAATTTNERKVDHFGVVVKVRYL
jgi:hypothetical protein